LLELRREALSLGKRFAVRGLPTQLGNLAALYGVAELLPPA
jgi:phospholipid transport system transporter-binding protein